MTNEEIRIAVAEELGIPVNVCMCGEHFDKHGTFCCHSFVPMADEHEVPDFPNSLDACAEFEATLITDEDKRDYVKELWKIVGGSPSNPSWDLAPLGVWFNYITASAAQKCVAYLRLRGRWKLE